MTEKNEKIINERVNALRDAIGKIEHDTTYWQDVTYVAGFGDLQHSTTRFTIWVNTKSIFFDFGNIYQDIKKLEKLFANAKGGYTAKGINNKTERRYKCSYEDGLQLVKTLFKPTTQKPKAKPKATSKKADEVKAS